MGTVKVMIDTMLSLIVDVSWFWDRNRSRWRYTVVVERRMKKDIALCKS
jgi:hypothetical protein